VITDTGYWSLDILRNQWEKELRENVLFGLPESGNQYPASY
jgi:hypothetical protein